MRTLLFILAAFFCGYQSVAQLSRTSLNSAKSIYTIKGDYYRNHNNHVFAVNNYSKATRLNPKDVAAMVGMAEAYHKLGKDDLASQWFRKALAINPEVGAAHILQYISILSATGNSAELRRWAAVYTNRIAKSPQHMDSAVFIADNLTALNSKGSDAAPLLYDNKLMFSSDRAGNGNFNSFKSALDTEGNFGEVSVFHGTINSGPGEGAFAIASNTATLFFTGTEQASASTPSRMEIFTSAIPAAPSDQVRISQLRFKKFDHSMGHPAVNSDGTVLYFTAHSPKHTRGFDLYRSEYDGKKWSAPVALGTSVNSHGDELHPVLANDSILYFASDGHGGLGGFDIFKVNLSHKHHQRSEHLPAPVNSVADDFAFVINNLGTEGYLSSNRSGGLGGNDLYRIYILPLGTKDKAASKHEELLIYTSKGDEIKLSGSSKENLKFDFQPGRKYNLVVEYDNFRKGTAQTISNAATLTRLNVYTFDIQKTSEAVYDQKNKSKPVQDIHINPGDLVTFQLIPNLVQDPEADVGKIQFHGSEAMVGDRESIMFSYVAEGGSGIPEADMSTVAGLSELDTLTSIQSVAAKEPPSKSDKKIAPATSLSPLPGTTQAPQEIAAPEPEKTQVADLNRPVPTDALTNTPASEKNVANLNTSPNATTQTDATTPETTAKESSDLPSVNNPSAEKSETDASTLQPANAVALQEQPTAGQNKDADPDVVTDKTIEAQQQALAQAQSGDKGPDSVRTQDVVVAAKEVEKDPAPAKNVNEILLTEPSNLAEKNVDGSKVATTTQQPDATVTTAKESSDLPPGNDAVAEKSEIKESSTQPATPVAALQEQPTVGQNKDADPDVVTDKTIEAQQQALAQAQSGDKGPDSVMTQDVVVAAKEVEKDPAPPATEQSGSTEKNIDNNKATADIAEAATKGNVVSTEIAKTTASPDLNDASQVPPLVPADAKLSEITDSNEIQYRVQIAASRSKLSAALLEKIYPGPRDIRSFNEEGYHKYYIEQTPHYPSAKRALNESGVGQAFIAAYQGNTKLTLHDAIAVQKNASSQNATPSIEANNTDAATETVAARNVQPENSTEVISESTAPGSTDANKEKQVLPVVPKPQDTSAKIPAREVNAQDNTEKKDLPVDVVGNNETSPTIVPVTEALITKENPVALSSADAVDTNEAVEGGDFQYRLQIAASKSVLSNARLKKIYPGTGEIRVFQEEGFYKYYILETSNYFVARQTLKKINTEQGFISAYKKDVKFPLQEAITSQYKVPLIQSHLAGTDSIVKITTVNFALDEFELQGDQLEHLRGTIISELKSNPSYHAIVNGYTDIRGSETYNFGLSQERALFVEQRIVAEGIEAERVTAQYFGESQLVKYCPEHENCDESIHQVNRRVEILLLINKK